MTGQPTPTAAVNPTRADLDGLASGPDDDAIIMVNLLRFRGEEGRLAYGRYGAVATGTVRARGGSIAYTAPVVDQRPAVSTEVWDTVTLVRYPRRAAYLDMQQDPAYVAAIPDRTAGLEARLLYPFHPIDGDPDDRFRIERSGGSELFVVELGRSGDGAGVEDPSSGEVVLRLRADVALVSDAVFDQLVVTRHRSVAELPTDLFDHRGDRDRITLVTAPAT